MKDLTVRVENLDKALATPFAISAVDLLSDDEIELLRTLSAIDPGDKDAFEPIGADEVKKGMLAQLTDLGFAYSREHHDGSIAYFGVSPKAVWAIDRHDKKAMEEARRIAQEASWRIEERKERRKDVYGGALFGFALGLLAPAAQHLIALIEASIGMWL